MTERLATAFPSEETPTIASDLTQDLDAPTLEPIDGGVDPFADVDIQALGQLEKEAEPETPLALDQVSPSARLQGELSISHVFEPETTAQPVELEAREQLEVVQQELTQQPTEEQDVALNAFSGTDQHGLEQADVPAEPPVSRTAGRAMPQQAFPQEVEKPDIRDIYSTPTTRRGALREGPGVG